MTSLYSINTDYTMVTKEILVNHTKHSQNRLEQRMITEDLVKKCLKWGYKEKISNKKYKYIFGDVHVIKAGNKREGKIITAYKQFKGLINEIM
mmetsp:Transcript_6833/g.6000  ORF Transcript_6833/g.6000 Transcript_6833/m.6000 type:complete len:93 (+) Transcript_6833:485-763(+)